MVYIFLKNLLKKWKVGVLVPLSLGLFVPLIASIWPDMREAADIFTTILSSPVYQAILGDMGLGNIAVWPGAFQMYIGIMLEYYMIGITIFVPAKIITEEINKRTLDVILSYPIARWRFLLEKFSVYLFYSLLYPLFIILYAFVSTKYLQYNYAHLNVEFDYLALTYAMIGTWMLFFCLGAIALLCATIILEPRKVLGASAVIIFGMYFLFRIGGMAESVEIVKYFSVFNYMNFSSIFISGTFPVGEFFILLGVGLAALAGAIIVFQKRELKY